MKVKGLKKLEKSEVALTVEVKGEEFTAAVDEAFRKNAKKIKVPGFRPGKATRKQIEALYGEGVFFDDAVQKLYPQAMEDAIKAKKLDVVELKDVNVESIDKEGFVFVATLVVKPEVEVKEYKGIKATKDVYTVTEAEVKDYLAGQQKKAERVVPVDRAVKTGDIAVIDYEGFLNGVAFEGGKGENYELEIGSGTFIPGFEDQLIGAKKGDQPELKVTFPKEYHAEDLKGKDVIFKVKVNEVREKQLPTIDDEFVKDVSEFDTLAEYKKDIKKKLKEQKDKQAQSELEMAVLEELVKNTVVEVPEAMIEKQIDNMERDFDSRLQMQGMKLDLYLKYTGMSKEAFREGFKEEAEKQVKTRLALEKVVEMEKIKATAKDVNAEYKKIADAYQMKVEQIKPYIAEADIKMDVAVGKAMELIMENAQITEKAVKPETKTAAKKPAAKKTASKTTAAKKPAAKKPAAKKTTAKKPAAKKEAADK